LLLLLLLIFNRYRVKQKANKLLQEKQDEINWQNQQLEKMVAEEKMITAEKDKLLQEKEWLMKEINHRVKNNLQVVMSLLNTQSAYLQDEAALNAIQESRHRVHAISLIHRKLYQSDQQLTTIDMANYIEDVTEYLADSLDTQHHIQFGLFIDPIELDVTQAVPTGLIINEAVTNAAKYAFPEDRKGQIIISMHKNVNGAIELTIQDNGIGLPPDFDWQQSESLGMSLMQGLCNQLDGQFNLIQHNGITIKITFEPAKSLKQ
jgi:two-component sensor histidine kinase